MGSTPMSSFSVPHAAQNGVLLMMLRHTSVATTCACAPWDVDSAASSAQASVKHLVQAIPQAEEADLAPLPTMGRQGSCKEPQSSSEARSDNGLTPQRLLV